VQNQQPPTNASALPTNGIATAVVPSSEQVPHYKDQRRNQQPPTSSAATQQPASSDGTHMAKSKQRKPTTKKTLKLGRKIYRRIVFKTRSEGMVSMEETVIPNVTGFEGG
jgi:hypothetical protein